MISCINLIYYVDHINHYNINFVQVFTRKYIK